MDYSYNVHVEDGVICVSKMGRESIEGFYFDSANSAEDNAQELYELLASANLEVVKY